MFGQTIPEILKSVGVTYISNILFLLSKQEGWNNKYAAARTSYKAELAKWEQSNPDKVKAIEEAKANVKAAVKATKPPAPKPAAKKKTAKKVAVKVKA